jgi:hypothetical protein
VPVGLNHEQFVKTGREQNNDNVYTAILKVEASLKGRCLSAEQQNENLKYLMRNNFGPGFILICPWPLTG